MSDPIAEIIGDYRAFAAQQRDRLLARGIDIAPYPLSHLAVRLTLHAGGPAASQRSGHREQRHPPHVLARSTMDR